MLLLRTASFSPSLGEVGMWFLSKEVALVWRRGQHSILVEFSYMEQT